MKQKKTRKKTVLSRQKTQHKQSTSKKLKSTAKKTLKKTKKTLKKISLKEVVTKVVNIAKKPFCREKKKEDTSQDGQIDNQQAQSSTSQAPYVDVPFAESKSRASFSKFFYTNEIDIDTFDDWQLYDYIVKHKPGLAAQQTNEQVKRSAIVDMLNDIQFMQQILADYNMTILDFFKFLFRLCPSVFKGLFVRKIQKTIKDKPYAQSIRFGSYTKRRKQSTKRCSIF